jgi:nitrate reductase delta subunit
MTQDRPENDYDNALSGWFSGRSPVAEADDLPAPAKTSPEHLAALDRVREWTRRRFKLADDAAILVSEIACNLPGCPPLETAIAFWSDEKRHHFKLFKQVSEVAFDDLPYTWMKDELVVPEGFNCECC